MGRRAGLALFGVVVVGGPMLGASASALSRPSAGTTITVTTTADDNAVNGNCSLREALRAANTDHAVDACPAGNGADTIVLPQGHYAIRSTLTVTSTVDVSGVNHGAVIDLHASPCTACGRAFFVQRPGGTLGLAGITIEHATTAIRNDGDLRLDRVTFDDESGSCGDRLPDEAGAIDNRGVASFHDITVTRTLDPVSNDAGAYFFGTGLMMTHNGPCDEGTTVRNRGTMSLTGATFDADVPGYGYASSIENDAAGRLQVQHSRFEHNTGGWGSAVIVNNGNALIDNSAFDRNENLPVVNSGSLRVARSRFSTNRIQFYGPGAIANSGDITVSESTIDHNAGSDGGGIVNMSGGRATLRNVTIDANTARHGTWSSPGGLFQAGAVTNDGVMMLRNTTVAANRIEGFADWPYHAGGVVTTARGYTALSNSVISQNITESGVRSRACFGAFHSLGYNLIDDLTGCFVGDHTTGNIYGRSAQLTFLSVNGGPTETAMPHWNSPLLDAGNPATPNGGDQATCAPFDQRLVARPRAFNVDGTARCDIGAVER